MEGTEQHDMNAGELVKVIDGLIDATERHARWLWQVNRSLVVGVPLDDEARCSGCYFEEWYESVWQRPQLKRNPLFHELRLRHNNGHKAVDRLFDRLRQGIPLAKEEYDAVVQANNRFKELSLHLERAMWHEAYLADSLTGLRNRHGMLEELREEQQRAIREGRPCGLAMMDVDHFKQVNDRFGHPAGDQVLRAVTRRVKSHLRPYDRVYRYGGEEFLLCLADSDLEQALAIIERLRAEIAQEVIPAGGDQLTVTVSFGLAPLVPDLPVESSIQQADRALYIAKMTGRNRVIVNGEGSSIVRSLPREQN